jgi:hypothetical protein
MKKWICILLILSLTLSLAACAQKKEQKFQKPVTFYYCRTSPSFGVQDGLIVGETRESAEYEGNLLGLLNRYISGPLTSDMIRPFPFAARIIACTVSEGSVFLEVSDTFTVLKGVDLTLAMACLTKTIYGITGIGTIHVKAQNAKFDGIEVVTMRIEDIFLYDSSQTPAGAE